MVPVKSTTQVRRAWQRRSRQWQRCSLGELLEGWVWRRISSALMAWDSEHGEGLARSMGSGAAAMADLNHGLGFVLGFERAAKMDGGDVACGQGAGMGNPLGWRSIWQGAAAAGLLG
ncbi:hypothetical protein M0R45_008921 [Rubus argutus]|uniref:Uncharacterized protein n=1 Tax=Rubus argutus TaxID=59490 RepID=A0AAW1Y332_RUBAR